jgi:hypothetical protein
MKKRYFTRVEFSECASVRHDGQVFFCDIKNVSLQGLYIKTDQELPLNTTVEITVYHSPVSSFRLNANVVRSDNIGLGMQIKQIDAHSFVRLQDVVAKHSNDQDLIMRETHRMARCIK